MLLSSDELEILEYLKSWNGKYVALLEICRCAGGRRKFRESPHWAKSLMSRLVEAQMIEVNERGHYRFPVEPKLASEEKPKPVIQGIAVGDDYFPLKEAVPTVVGEDYFPPVNSESENNTKFWISPQMEEILRRSGKKLNDSVIG